MKALLLVGAAVVAMLAVAACGDDDSGGGPFAGNTSNSNSSATKASSGNATQSGGGAGTNAGEKSITGDLKITGGKAPGTYKWNSELAADYCATIRLGITMSDGADSFIAIDTSPDDSATGLKSHTSLTGGKLANTYTGDGAKFKLQQLNLTLGAKGTISWSNTQLKAANGDSVTIDGTLTVNCP